MPATTSGHVLLVERKRGPQFYAKVRRPDGTQVKRHLGPAWTKRSAPPPGYLTHEQAAARLQDVLASVTAPAPATVTFAQACEEFLRHREQEGQRNGKCAPSTLRGYRPQVDVMLGHFGAGTPLARITQERVEGFRSYVLHERGVSAVTARGYMVTLYGVMDRARRRRWIAANPCEDVERIGIPPRSGRVDGAILSVAQVWALARAASNEQEAALYVTAAFTGLRQGELRALRWRDVDFTGSVLRVERSLAAGTDAKRHGFRISKSGRVRSVPLAPDVARVLDGLSQRERFTGPADLVFPNTVGEPMNTDLIRRAFHESIGRAGLGHLRSEALPKHERLVFHSLRHCFGTLAVRRFPVTDVQQMMGHANVQTTMVYVHYAPQTDAAIKMGDLIAQESGVDGYQDRDGVPTGYQAGTERTQSGVPERI